MYTIMMNDDKELLSTVRETIYEKETNVDTLRFLIPPDYDDLDLTKCCVLMKYVTPDRKNRSEKLYAQDELYKGYIDYRFGVDTKVTALPGDVDVRLTFLTVDKNENGLQDEVLHSGTITITVESLKNLYGFNSNESLEIIDQIANEFNAKIEAVNNIASSLKCDCDCEDNVWEEFEGKPTTPEVPDTPTPPDNSCNCDDSEWREF